MEFNGIKEAMMTLSPENSSLTHGVWLSSVTNAKKRCRKEQGEVEMELGPPQRKQQTAKMKEGILGCRRIVKEQPRKLKGREAQKRAR